MENESVSQPSDLMDHINEHRSMYGRNYRDLCGDEVQVSRLAYDQKRRIVVIYSFVRRPLLHFTLDLIRFNQDFTPTGTGAKG